MPSTIKTKSNLRGEETAHEIVQAGAGETLDKKSSGGKFYVASLKVPQQWKRNRDAPTNAKPQREPSDSLYCAMIWKGKLAWRRLICINSLLVVVMSGINISTSSKQRQKLITIRDDCRREQLLPSAIALIRLEAVNSAIKCTKYSVGINLTICFHRGLAKENM